MPAVTILFPMGIFDDVNQAEISKFKWEVIRIVAKHMDAINPSTGQMTDFAADSISFIDLAMVPYDRDLSSTTVPLLGTIVTYGWPDRTATLPKRMEAITREVRAIIPFEHAYEDMELISFTFLPKLEGAWFAA